MLKNRPNVMLLLLFEMVYSRPILYLHIILITFVRMKTVLSKPHCYLSCVASVIG